MGFPDQPLMVVKEYAVASAFFEGDNFQAFNLRPDVGYESRIDMSV